MVSFKENLTPEKHELEYKLASKRLVVSKAIWGAIFGALLTVFLILAIINNLESYVYIIFSVFLVLVVYANFFHGFVMYLYKHKKLAQLLSDNSEVHYVQIDFNAEHVAITSPLYPKKNVIRIDYERLSQIFFDPVNKILFFLQKGDAEFYFTLFLEYHDKNEIKEMVEIFPNNIINEDELENYLGVKLDRLVAVTSDDVIRDSAPKREEKESENNNE